MDPRSRLLAWSLYFLGVPVPRVYTRRVDLSALAFSLSSHRHSCISLLFLALVLSLNNKQKKLDLNLIYENNQN